MKAANLLCLSVLVLIGFSAQGQHSTSREVVMYDPLFWRQELALRNEQSRKIEQINTEFYESLRLLSNDRVAQRDLTKQLEKGLQQRSQQIWDTLMPKQRRKLEKIIDKTAPIVTAP